MLKRAVQFEIESFDGSGRLISVLFWCGRCQQEWWEEFPVSEIAARMLAHIEVCREP